MTYKQLEEHNKMLKDIAALQEQIVAIMDKLDTLIESKPKRTRKTKSNGQG